MANRLVKTTWNRATQRAWHAASWTLLAVWALVALTGCAVPAPSPPEIAGTQNSITGTATFSERTILPANAVFEASLEEIGEGGIPTNTIATTNQQVAGVSAVNFSIQYVDSQIRTGRRYGVRARVLVNGALLFVTEQATPVLLDEQEKSVTIALLRPGAPARQPPAPMQPRIAGAAADAKAPSSAAGRAAEARGGSRTSRAEAQAKAKEEAQARAEARSLALAEARARAQAQMQARAEATSRAQAEAQERIRAETQARAEVKARAQAQAESEAQAQSEAKARAQAEKQSQAQAEAQARIEAQARAQAEAQAEAQAQAEARSRAQAELLARAQAEAQAQAEATARAQAELQARAQAETRARGEAEARIRGELQAQAEAKARAETEMQSRAQAESQARAQAETQAKAQAEAQARAEAEAKARRESLAQAAAAAAPVPTPVPGPASAATPVPAPVPAPVAQPALAATPQTTPAPVSIAPPSAPAPRPTPPAQAPAQRTTPAEAAARAAGQTTVLRGLYRFTADAGTFEDCDSGARIPVSQEGSNFILEGAYLRLFSRSGGDPGVLATVDGRVLQRPGPNGNPRSTLVVDRFISLGGETCPSVASTAPVAPVPAAPLMLENTRWKLEQLNQQPVEQIEKQREPYIVLQSASKRATGSASCNQLLLVYTLEGNTLRFTEGGVTARTCTTGMEQEKAFLAALSDVDSFAVEGKTLRLQDTQKRVLVQMRAEDF